MSTDYSQPYDVQSHATGVTVAEAARRLGVTPDAIRQRIRRKTIRSSKIRGHIYVFLDQPTDGANATAATVSIDDDKSAVPYADHDARDDLFRQVVEQAVAGYRLTIEQLSSEVAFLREELRRREPSAEPSRSPLPEDFRPDGSVPNPRRRRWWWPFSSTA